MKHKSGKKKSDGNLFIVFSLIDDFAIKIQCSKNSRLGARRRPTISISCKFVLASIGEF